MRASRDQHHLIKSYAAAAGISVRTAQWHRQTRNPEYLEFVSREASAKIRTDASPESSQLAPAPPSAQESAASEPSLPAQSREEIMEQKAYESWRAVASERNRAIVSRDPNIVAWCKAEAVAQESYRKAKRARELADLAASRMVPASQISDLRRRFLFPLRSVIQNMPQEVGPRANSFDPGFGIAACQEWLKTRFNPQLDAALREFEKFSPAAA